MVETSTSMRVRTHPLLAALLALQGALFAVSAVESLVIGVSSGLPVTLPFLLSITMAVVIFASLGRLPGRLLKVIEWFALSTATLDLLLSLFLAHSFLEPVAVVTRIVIPVAVLRFARKGVTV